MKPTSIIAGILAAVTLVGAGLAAAQSSDGLNRRIRVHNQTGLTIRVLQAADVRTGSYAENLVAGSPLDSGASRQVTIDAGNNVCLFDLRAELTSGQTVTRENVNVCRVADVYLTR